MICCSRFGEGLYTRGFFMCPYVQKRRTIAEGYSDDLDDKKNMGLYDFLQPIWGPYTSTTGGGGRLYTRGLYTKVYTVLK